MLFIECICADSVLMWYIRLPDVHAALDKMASGALHSGKLAFSFNVRPQLIEGVEATHITKFVGTP